jgi:hypothetical protein
VRHSRSRTSRRPPIAAARELPDGSLEFVQLRMPLDIFVAPGSLVHEALERGLSKALPHILAILVSGSVKLTMEAGKIVGCSPYRDVRF